MKIRYIICAPILLMCISYSRAEHNTDFSINLTNTSDYLREADKKRDGDESDLDYGFASKMYEQLVEQGNPHGMNRLAGMYRQGLGVEKNLDSAIFLYEKAIEKGYGKAAYNLSVMFKTGEAYGKPDYPQAYTYAQKAQALGYKKSSYLLGYMNFKGLGISQDYKKALEFFSQGEIYGDIRCTYFIGICYLGGYGVKKNIEKGKEYIEKAMHNGSEMATDFIIHDKITNYTKVRLRSSSPLEIEKKGTYTEIANNPSKAMTGVWEGRIIQYDWSGKQIRKEKSLQLQLDFLDNRISGTWIQDDSIDLKIRGQLVNNEWHFSDMIYTDQTSEREWEIKNGRFSVRKSEDYIVLEGNIEQYSPETNEPSSPLSIVLLRSSKDNINDIRKQYSDFAEIYPNPFEKDLHISLTISKSQQVLIQLYSTDGQRFHSQTTELNEGVNNLTLQVPSIPRGVYTVYITGETLNETSKVIKK
ncbi:MAG: SEL1-like repeat protein [Paludibacteraceae bacterium]|nr:SEL1-like repeat protein [Paludibacteraceae bacterium]